jgi:hypothetical protein
MGIASVATPMVAPRITSISDLRLCSGIFTKREFPAIGVATGGGKNNEDGGDADDADDSEGEVGRGERGPGGDGSGHGVVWLTVLSIVPLGGGAKGG